MSPTEWAIAGLGAVLAVYVLAVAALIAAGRRTEARALAGFIPDCLIMLRRLLGDHRVPRRRKLVLVALVGYLSLPFDLVPDFVPVAGQLDDVIVAALALRYVLRSGGPDLLREHWPGPAVSLDILLRLAHGRGGSARLATGRVNYAPEPMSQDNVACVRRAYEAWNRDDLEAALSMTHPEVEWRTSGAFPDLKPVYRGHAGLREWWQAMKDPWEYFVIQLEELIPNGDAVLAVLKFEARGKGSGVDVTLPFVNVWHVRDGLVVKWTAHRSLEEAQVAAGLSALGNTG